MDRLVRAGAAEAVKLYRTTTENGESKFNEQMEKDRRIFILYMII